MRTAAAIGACLACGALLAQDPDPFLSPGMLLNPSRAGFAPGVGAAVLHQDQWLQAPGSWTHDALAADACLRNTKKPVDSWLGVGLTAARTRQGLEGGHLASIGLVPAVHLRSGKRSWISAGLELRWVNGAFGPADGSWASQYSDGRYDGGLPSGESWTAANATWAEARAGLSFTLKQEEESRFRRARDLLVAGFAADHLGRLMLHREGNTLAESPVRGTAFVQAQWPLGSWENSFLAGELTGQWQGPFRSGRIGVFAGKDLLNRTRDPGGPMLVGYKAGVGYRWPGALLASAAIDLGKASFGMAYGWGLARRDAIAGGRRTFELTVQLRSAP